MSIHLPNFHPGVLYNDLAIDHCPCFRRDLSRTNNGSSLLLSLVYPGSSGYRVLVPIRVVLVPKSFASKRLSKWLLKEV